MQPTEPRDYQRGQLAALEAALAQLERLVAQLRREAASLRLPTRKPTKENDR